jgi:hypothetical protein
MSPLKQEQLPRILAFINLLNRPWSEAETMELFNNAMSGGIRPRALKRTYGDCVHHWINVISMVFREDGKPIEDSILSLTRRFFEDEGNTSWSCSQTLAANMVIGYVKHKTGLDSNAGKPLDECEAYFKEFWAWVASQRGRSTNELIFDAITAYYQQDNQGVCDADI